MKRLCWFVVALGTLCPARAVLAKHSRSGRSGDSHTADLAHQRDASHHLDGGQLHDVARYHHSFGGRGYGYRSGGYFSFGAGAFAPAWYGSPYYVYGMPYGYGYSYILPPLFVSPEAVYGFSMPRPDIGFPAQPQFNPAPQVNIIVPKAEAKEKLTPKIRQSNAATLARAWKFVQIGDKYFDQQRYREAYHRYKEATAAAPDFVEGWLRQGQAMVAAAHYDVAATAFKRMMRTLPEWSESGFRLDDFYGGKGIAKKAHLEAVADAAAQNPVDGDLLLLVGLQLYLDGEHDRAKPFLKRAAQLLADDELHLKELASDKKEEEQQGIGF